MQAWFFVEDPRNALIRRRAGEARGEGDEIEGEAETVLPETKRWFFKVRATTGPNEIVCVTGNVPELGCWNPDDCFQLDDAGDGTWKGYRDIPGTTNVLYRYCVRDANRVRSWETNVPARSIDPQSVSPTKSDPPETYGSYDGATSIDKGWLTKGAIVRFKLHQQSCLTITKPRYESRSVFVRITPASITHLNVPISSRHDPSLSVSVCRSNAEDGSSYRPQGAFGEEILPSGVVTFETCPLDPDRTAFLVDFYVYGSRTIDDDPPYLCGVAYLPPEALGGESAGRVALPITSVKQKPLGELRLEYLVVRPLANVRCDMSVSYSRAYWNFGGHQTVDCAKIVDGSVASLKAAVDHGADMIEIGVRLSKDLQPMVHRDSVVKFRGDQETLETVPISELTLRQLQLLKRRCSLDEELEELEDREAFVTLRTALDVVDVHCGFDIEIGRGDAADLNEIIDVILETVLGYAGERNVVFSSFDADVCTMIRTKQDVYPVLFSMEARFKDAVKFVATEKLLGLKAHVDEILRQPSLVEYAKSAEIVLICGAVDRRIAATTAFVKDLGLNAVIYDHFYESLDEKGEKNVFVLEAGASQSELVLAEARREHIAKTTSIVAVSNAAIDLQQLPTDDVSTVTSLISLESARIT